MAKTKSSVQTPSKSKSSEDKPAVTKVKAKSTGVKQDLILGAVCNDKAGSPGAIIEVLGVWSVEADAKASVDYFLAQNGSSFTQRIRGALFTVELGVGKFVSPGDPLFVRVTDPHEHIVKVTRTHQKKLEDKEGVSSSKWILG